MNMEIYSIMYDFLIVPIVYQISSLSNVIEGG